MFGGGKGWFSSNKLWKPKNIHSTDYLNKNAIVTEHNQQLLIEAWRLISEILIWGDQNDSKVFEFFLEKNMLTFFIAYVRQPSARFIMVQLLQTLNILFENTSRETSIYFLLSNNHVNDIIMSKFDFSDEEVMAYYISVLKALSLKLNAHTIYFFFNEHTRNFPLLTEALKFESHPESMVRIAARTITLNVYRIRNPIVTRFVCDRIAPAQFSNFAYNVSRQALAMNECLTQAQGLLQHQQLHQESSNSTALPSSGKNSISTLSRIRDKLQDYSADNLDQLHYAADVLHLEIEEINAVVIPLLLSRFLVPVYLPSLIVSGSSSITDIATNAPRISRPLALNLVSHFLVVFKSHSSVLEKFLGVIANGDAAVNKHIIEELSPLAGKAPESLSDAIARSSSLDGISSQVGNVASEAGIQSVKPPSRSHSMVELDSITKEILSEMRTNQTDEQKLAEFTQSLEQRVYLSSIMAALDAKNNSGEESDYETVFALTLLLSIVNNSMLSRELLTTLGLNSKLALQKSEYNCNLIDKLINLLTMATKQDSKIRPVTLALSSDLLKSQVLLYASTSAGGTTDSVFSGSTSPPLNSSNCLSDHDLARIESAREESMLVLRSFFKSEDTFVDTFEDEFNHFYDRRRVNVERILGDSNLLLQPAASSPLSGVDFAHRLPCGEAERTRLAMRTYFTLRDLSLQMRGETETELPLFKIDAIVNQGDALDLNNSDILQCSVTVTNEKTERLFLVLERDQLILVRPDVLRMGWGIVRLAGPLYDVELTTDRDDGRGLHVTLHPLIVSTPIQKKHSSISSSASANVAYTRTLVSAKFQFDDHIRCRAARERIIRGRQRVRQLKLQKLAALLEIPPEATAFLSTSASHTGTNSPQSIPSPVVSSTVLSMFNPVVQKALMAVSPPAVARYLPQSMLQNASVSKSVLSTDSTDTQLIGMSVSSSTSDVAASISDPDHHRKKLMQSLGVVATPPPGSSNSSNDPAIPLVQTKSVSEVKEEENMKASEKSTREGKLISLDDEVEEDSAPVIKPQATNIVVDTDEEHSDDSLILKKAIEELASTSTPELSEMVKDDVDQDDAVGDTCNETREAESIGEKKDDDDDIKADLNLEPSADDDEPALLATAS